jgi:hypothetical protein
VAGPTTGYGYRGADLDRSAVDEDTFGVVHALALRGALPRLPPGTDGLVREGLVHATPRGFELTAVGHSRHRALLERERRTLDLGRLSMAYARLPAVTRRLRDVMLEWEANDEPARRPMVGQLCGVIEDVEPILHRSAAVAPRFAGYRLRLAAARSELLACEVPAALGSRVESILAIWREMTEDYLQTLGFGHEQVDL